MTSETASPQWIVIRMEYSKALLMPMHTFLETMGELHLVELDTYSSSDNKYIGPVKKFEIITDEELKAMMVKTRMLDGAKEDD